MDKYFDWFKYFHIVAVICWMAGMLYLPRLFVYHTEVKSGTKEDKRFQIMEMRLQKFIINPSMIATIIFGLLQSYIYGLANLGLWFHLKLCFVIMMMGVHGYLTICRKAFIYGKNSHSKKFFKILNEIPTLLMLIIIWLVVLKPFEA